jgi:hypothetical protein
MLLRSVRANRHERTRLLPGDESIAAPVGSLTHAVTIHGSAREVWPWLVQMGAGTRAGWYSYDRIDNGGRRSSDRIVPELQAIDVGTLFPARPGVTDGFHVLQYQPEASLVLGWVPAGRGPLVTWAFTIDVLDERTSRLVTRARAGGDYPFYGLPPALGLPFIRAGHFVMQRRQLLGIARRVEAARQGSV